MKLIFILILNLNTTYGIIKYIIGDKIPITGDKKILYIVNIVRNELELFKYFKK